jgi:hypothetical protein
LIFPRISKNYNIQVIENKALNENEKRLKNSYNLIDKVCKNDAETALEAK